MRECGTSITFYKISDIGMNMVLDHCSDIFVSSNAHRRTIYTFTYAYSHVHDWLIQTALNDAHISVNSTNSMKRIDHKQCLLRARLIMHKSLEGTASTNLRAREESNSHQTIHYLILHLWINNDDEQSHAYHQSCITVTGNNCRDRNLREGEAFGCGVPGLIIRTDSSQLKQIPTNLYQSHDKESPPNRPFQLVMTSTSNRRPVLALARD